MLKKLKKLVLWVKNPVVTLVSAIIFCCCALNVAQAINLSTISQVYFFGDSLTDGGFNDLWPTQGIPGLPLPFGKAPTVTTYGGYTWSQYVARDIKGFQLPIYPGPTVPDTITNNSIFAVPSFVSGTLTGVNYAAAGSTTNSIGVGATWAPSLRQQVAHFLASIPPGQNVDPNAVFFVWSGANDFLAILSNVPPLPAQIDLLRTAQTAANNIGIEVGLLSARGAKRIVVISLPNLSFTPFATRLAAQLGDPTIPGKLKNLAFTFDSMLNTQLGKVVQRYGTKILYVNLYTLLEQVVNAAKAGNPFVIAGQSFRFTNFSDVACPNVISAIYCPSTAPSGYIFADEIHPTNEAHRIISLQVEKLLQNWE